MRRMSWVVVFVGVALAPFAFAGPGTVEVDVSDLVLERPGPTTYPVGWRIRPSNASGPVRFIMGESNLLTDEQHPEELPELGPNPTPLGMGAWPPLVDGQALLTAVASASKVAANTLTLEDGVLKVPEEDAQAVRAAVAALRKAGPPVVQLDVALDTVDEDGESASLFTVAGVAQPGLPHVFADAMTSHVLTDYEVEIAQACVIANPVIQIRRTGTSLLTRVHPLPNGEQAVVEAVMRVAVPLPDQPIDLGHPGFGDLDRCLTGYEETAVAFLAENGKPSEQLWTGREGRAMRFTFTATWAAPEQGERLLWSSLLDRPIAGFKNVNRRLLLPDQIGDEEGPGTTTRFAPQRVFAGPDGAQRGGAMQLELEVLLVPAGVAVEPGQPLPDGAREVARARAHVIAGLPACFNASQEQLYLLDWDVEVAQAARVPDPYVGALDAGHFLQATFLQRGAHGTVALDLQLRRLSVIDRIVMPLDVAQSSAGVQGDIRRAGSGGGSTGSIYTAPSMPQDTVAIERPQVRSLRITSQVPLGSDGTGMLRRSARGFTGEAKDLVVVVRRPLR